MSSFLHVIVVSFNTCSKTLQCLRYILHYTDLPFQLWVVDNASTDGSIEMLRELAAQHQPRLTLTLLPENVGYTRAIASIYSHLPPHGHVCFINSDVYVGPGYANKLYKHLERHPDIAAVAPLGRGIGGWQDILKYHPPLSLTDEFNEAILVQVNQALQDTRPKAITAKCLQGTIWMAKRAALDEIGELDTGCVCGADDADWSLRARLKNWRLLVALDTYVWHDNHSSFSVLEDQGKTWITQSWDHFNQKWSGCFDHLSWENLMESSHPTAYPAYEYEEFIT
ncbi:glycosyltransferase family 2 protein [Ferroacidibacillus organovorans]|uniref:Glycosyltransferase 2-like domain-containing protein n=1 Tax=Ferroacidibacillus organovorans TaxID=1765683 RepID=A0A101XRN6_9BACL|nr:glycosyltransferase [Ferroacidibacillus organovorans]KUO96283.1 hypothetical protein ATW55_03475 [Ferroacidibacillus organovorans]